MGTANARSALRLDEFLPTWDFREQHVRRIAAPADKVGSALRAITAKDIPFSSLMLGLRVAPAALMARKRPPALDRPVLDIFVDLGFLELVNTQTEIVLGTVGQFWRFREELVPLSSPDEFSRFKEPGFAKAAINFHIADGGETTRLSTETRVRTTDDRARRLFQPYWIPVRAVGGLMRSEMLRAVGRRAMSSSGGSTR